MSEFIVYMKQSKNAEKLWNYHKIITKLLVEKDYSEPPQFHKDILKHYQSKDRQLCILAPVGFAKSSTIKSYALHQLLRQVDNDYFILYVSSTASKVISQFTSMTKIINNETFMALHNYVIDVNNSNNITLHYPDGNKRRILGVASQSDISGINFEARRPSLIIIDDIEELEQSKSIYRTENLIEWMNTTLKSRLPSLSTGKMRMIGTNLTKNSIANRMMNNLPNLRGEMPLADWRLIKYKALDENNKSIWEDKHPTQYLLREKEMNVFSFASNYMNEPMDTFNGLVNYDDLRFYSGASTAKEIYIHIDPTHTGKQTSDYFCIGAVGETEDKFYDVVDFVLDKIDVEKQARTTIAFVIKLQAQGYNIRRITFDAVSNDGFGYWVKKLAREEYDLSLPLEPVKIPTDKVSHFTPHLPHFYSNRLRFYNKHRQLQLGIDQLLGFPNTDHDDFVDMLSGCLDNFKKTERLTLDQIRDKMNKMQVKRLDKNKEILTNLSY